MKQTLPAINIPARRIQDIPQSPISVTSSIPSTLRTPPDDVHSFAVIWEDHGHGAFEYTKSPMSHFSGFHADPYGPLPVDVEPPSPFFPETDEPFAILGSVGRSNPCFMSLESEKEYDKFIHTGLTPERVRTKKLSTYKPRSNRSDSQNVFQNKVNMKLHTRPSPLLPPLPRNVYRPEIPTPQSALTFAAVWDPDNEGMSTFCGGRFFENTYQPPPALPGKEDELLEHARIRSRYMLPKNSDARTKTVASSTLNGLDIYIPQPKPTPLKVQPKKTRRPPTIEVDDEGFFETFSDPGHGHADCEPHLSSRFSVTTTSTSNYIDVDFPESVHEEPVPPVPPLHKLERSESLASLKSAISPPFLLLPTRRPSNGSTSSFNSIISKSHSLTRSKSSPGSARGKTSSPSSFKQPRPRLSNVFGKLRRNSQDEGWVSVEVKAVITERVIKEA